MEIQDRFGRSFKTLRVSLTNTCNLACLYCVHSADQKLPTLPANNILNSSEIVHAIKKIHELTKLETVRLTGGEPTLYKELISIVRQIKALGVDNIKMTSNGYTLKNLIPELSEAGLKKINISLDTINPENFNKISGRKNLERILDSIDEALKYNIEIKINAVILKRINDDQIIPLFEFSKERNITLRFLELMRMGPLYEESSFHNYYTSEKEILDCIAKQHIFTPLLRETSSTANYWITPDGYKFGIIANESHPFCHDCNRLRLDSYGNIYGCLSNDTALSISEVLNNEGLLREKLEQALSHKQELKFTGSAISMMAIGG
jgi:cyclic pyranopterin phosphate synthase